MQNKRRVASRLCQQSLKAQFIYEQDSEASQLDDTQVLNDPRLKALLYRDFQVSLRDTADVKELLKILN